MSQQRAYNLIFKDYPDILTIEQLCDMLGGISIKTGYRMLRCGKIKGFKIGKRYKIPKVNVLKYLELFDENAEQE